MIWPRFAVAIWNDPRSWSTGQIGHGSATGFLWVHALLIAASLAIGSIVGYLGVRGVRASYGRSAAAAVPAVTAQAAGGEITRGRAS